MKRYLFDKIWFKEKQKLLLWLLNTPLIKIWFRWCMRIRGFDLPLKEKITEITPNSFSWGNKLVLALHLIFRDGHAEVFDQNCRKHRKLKVKLKTELRLALEKTTDFRAHNKFSKRVYYAFRPLWALFHAWDILIANNLNPAWNLGFDTFYPEAGHGGENTSVDGRLWYNGNEVTWATIHDAEVGTTSAPDEVGAPGEVACGIYMGDESSKFDYLGRSIFIIDTSDLPDGAIITSAIFSAKGVSAHTGTGWEVTANVFSSNPASNNDLVSADYNITGFGATAYADTGIACSSWNQSAYNDFTFNADGKTAVSKISVTKLALLDATYDVADSAPGWGSIEHSYISPKFADTAGTTSDPKLVVAYIVAISVSDVGVGAEIVGMIGEIPVADQGSGAEVINALEITVISIQDVGVGLDLMFFPPFRKKSTKARTTFTKQPKPRSEF